MKLVVPALLLALSVAAAPLMADEPLLASLCYHRFGPETRKDDYSISLERLGGQLDWLKAEGWQSVSLSQVAAALDGHKGALPPKAILLSVDDGYQAGALAAPLFEARGFRAVYFVYPQALGHGKFMTVAELKALEARGHEVASHSWSHPNIAKVGAGMSPADYAAFVQHELKDSRVRLEQILGHPVTALAWPFGAYNSVLAQVALQAGYTQLWTVSGGINPQSGLDASRLRRVLLMGRTPLEAFKRNLSRRLADASAEGLAEGDLVFKSQLPLEVTVKGRGVAALLGEKALPLAGGKAIIPAASAQGFKYLNLQQGGGPTLRRTPLLFQIAPDEWRPHFAALTQTPKP